jgi:hypothetical protein
MSTIHAKPASSRHPDAYLFKQQPITMTRMHCLITALFALLPPLVRAQAPADTTDRIADSINIQGRDYPSGKLPGGLVLMGEVGVAGFPWVQYNILHHARSRQGGLYETRATRTPKGDYLLMFPDGGHYGPGKGRKVNDMLAMRSSDGGRTWSKPVVAFDIDYNQHGFIPFIPKGSARIYAFGTQPVFSMYEWEDGNHENTPIGYRYSDDDGRTWSEVRFIRPRNDPGFRGMSVMRMTETPRGTWILGSHEADWSYKPLITRQYMLRSADKGATWELLPGKRHGGWHAKGYGRMDEGRPISIGGDSVMALLRTPEGHLWQTFSPDDGRNWSAPRPTPLVHPDAPPMLFPLSDGKTLIAFHHNRHHDTDYTGLSGTKKEQMMDRSELWFSLSTDGGRSWSAPRFFLVNALAEAYDRHFRNYQCSYIDAFTDGGTLHVFIPHRWERVLYLRVREADLARFPARQALLTVR